MSDRFGAKLDRILARLELSPEELWRSLKRLRPEGFTMEHAAINYRCLHCGYAFTFNMTNWDWSSLASQLKHEPTCKLGIAMATAKPKSDLAKRLARYFKGDRL